MVLNSGPVADDMLSAAEDEYLDDQDAGYTRQRVRDQQHFAAHEVDLSDADGSARGTTLYHQALSHKSPDQVASSILRYQGSPPRVTSTVLTGCCQQAGKHGWSGDEAGSQSSSDGRGSSYFSGEVLHTKDSPAMQQVCGSDSTQLPLCRSRVSGHLRVARGCLQQSHDNGSSMVSQLGPDVLVPPYVHPDSQATKPVTDILPGIMHTQASCSACRQTDSSRALLQSQELPDGVAQATKRLVRISPPVQPKGAAAAAAGSSTSRSQASSPATQPPAKGTAGMFCWSRGRTCKTSPQGLPEVSLQVSYVDQGRSARLPYSFLPVVLRADIVWTGRRVHFHHVSL